MSMGIRFGRSQGMEGSTGNLHEFAISDSNTDAIFTGDLVRLDGGYLIEASGAADNNDFSAVGVFAGCKYEDGDGSFTFKPYWDGGSGRKNIMGLVAVPGQSTFLISGDPTANYTQADIGTRKGIKYSAGNPKTGMSGITLGAAGATVATGPLMVTKQVDFANEVLFEIAIVRSELLQPLEALA